MRLKQSYVLVLGQPSDDLRMLLSFLERLKCRTILANSADQMMATACSDPPYLVILSGSHQNWSNSLVNQLRSFHNTRQATIVALTEHNSPSWLPQEDHPGLDGFLVKPLSSDVLTSLVQSAWARQACCSEI